MYPGANRDFITVGNARHGGAGEPGAHQIRAAEFGLRLSQQDRSPSTWRPPMCARKAPDSICRWPWGFWARWEWWRARTSIVLVGELSLDGSHPAGARRAFHRGVRAAAAGIANLHRAGRQRRRGRGGRGRARVRRAAPGRSRGTAEPAGPVPAGGPPVPRASRNAAVAVAARFRRRARADHGQASAGSGGGGRAQRADDRAAGIGQDHAGEAVRRHPAAVDLSRKRFETTQIHSVAGLLPNGVGLLRAAAVSRAAPHHFRRGPDRRRRRACRVRAK